MRLAVADSPLMVNGKELPITVSIGVATAGQPMAGSVGELFELADAGLYKAKEQGRNRCVAIEDASLV